MTLDVDKVYTFVVALNPTQIYVVDNFVYLRSFRSLDICLKFSDFKIKFLSFIDVR